jgi:HAMP domain-containing protein
MSSEIEEARPRDTHIEVWSRAGKRPMLSLGAGPQLASYHSGCVGRDALRICAVSGMHFVAAAARDRADEVAARDQLFAGLGIACLLAGAAVAFSSRWVTRRSLQPLLHLASAVTTIEPGHGQPSQWRGDLAEIDALATRFNAFASAQSRLDNEQMELVNLADLTASQLDELRRGHPCRRIEAQLPDEALVRGDERLLGRASANHCERCVSQRGVLWR